MPKSKLTSLNCFHMISFYCIIFMTSVFTIRCLELLDLASKKISEQVNWTWLLPVYSLLAGRCREFSCCQPTSPGLFPLGCFPITLHPGCSTKGVIVAEVQSPSLVLVEPHAVGLSPSIQPVHVPLQSSPTLQQTNTLTQLGVVCKFTKASLSPLIQIA